ncbi:MAG TPA: HD domain-containing protein [Longimicrobium sp.]
MLKPKSKLYADQIYGTKVISPLAVAIIDTPEFQRLASLRQLGFAELVYRGACHTRFSHSIGTYFIARTLLRKIAQNHERFDLEHPGSLVSEDFQLIPSNADIPDTWGVSPQSRWRGLTEIVSVAALLHDISHIPFGHTFEDEYTGLFTRHDRLGSSRLAEFLFNPESQLARVFSDDHDRWLPRLRNSDLRQLLYLILSWKEKVDPPTSFPQVLSTAIQDAKQEQERDRLRELEVFHEHASQDGVFQPFMSDLVGNTICADLWDYLPRDRINLGMEARLHRRLQRYLVIRRGTFFPDEGFRISIVVQSQRRGGQRRDVATAVLDIMRERYEMVERVYYHHKKAAASAMLVKLLELLPEDLRPRDDTAVYPAPWSSKDEPTGVPHLVHLGDAELLTYLGNASIERKPLQKKLYSALRFARADIYRTLLVIDVDLVNASKHTISYFLEQMRGPAEAFSGEHRQRLEDDLAAAAGVDSGNVLIYCPNAQMQAKEVDVRLEIVPDRILPLRVQREFFAYQLDLEVLERYYRELWKAYIFVDPKIFDDPGLCKAVVDCVCARFDIPLVAAYPKVRHHQFAQEPEASAAAALTCVRRFIERLPFKDVPQSITSALLDGAAGDARFLSLLASTASDGSAVHQRLTALFGAQVITSLAGTKGFPRKEKKAALALRSALLAGEADVAVAARLDDPSYDAYLNRILLLIRHQVGARAVEEADGRR